MKSSICCVVPSIRETQMAEFRKAWAHLFNRHSVTLITVRDGENPTITVNDRADGEKQVNDPVKWKPEDEWKNLFFRKTDAIRNLGFAFVAGTCHNDADYILTLDDDVHPPAGSDPIQEHLDVLQRRVPISWMNMAMDMGTITKEGVWDTKAQSPYLRGFPYGIRDEAPAMVSHGVWVNVPDFDGRTQLKLTNNGQNPERLPYSLPYFRGPVPRGTYFPFCGMNVMVHRDALPYLYFAPMGPDTGIEGLNRFADIWCGLLLKRACDSIGWAIYTGESTVIHTRASDPFKNVEQEKLGIEWNEWAWKFARLTEFDRDGMPFGFENYWRSYLDKATRFRDLIRKLQGAS